jgi:hypothetical protein
LLIISGDPEQEYFTDGMTEEIINALANVEGLKVISRTSSFFFKGKDVDLRTIGNKLSVDNVIEGKNVVQHIHSLSFGGFRLRLCRCTKQSGAGKRQIGYDVAANV